VEVRTQRHLLPGAVSHSTAPELEVSLGGRGPVKKGAPGRHPETPLVKRPALPSRGGVRKRATLHRLPLAGPENGRLGVKQSIQGSWAFRPSRLMVRAVEEGSPSSIEKLKHSRQLSSVQNTVGAAASRSTRRLRKAQLAAAVRKPRPCAYHHFRDAYRLCLVPS
jgi:hypothetical protein